MMRNLGPRCADNIILNAILGVRPWTQEIRTISGTIAQMVGNCLQPDTFAISSPLHSSTMGDSLWTDSTTAKDCQPFSNTVTREWTAATLAMV